MAKTKFPTLAIILLVVAVVWLFNELNYFSIDIPWIPVVLIIIAIGMIVNRYSK
jgi:multisubunit Na+/H+ antiporter MnhG subunit